MKRQWLSLLALLVVATGSAWAGPPAQFLPAVDTGRSMQVIQVQAPAPMPPGAPVAGQPEAIAAPMSVAPATAASPCGSCCATNACCPDACCGRQRKERFNLCDYWQILCACFYCK